jgi:hypothetical protein
MPVMSVYQGQRHIFNIFICYLFKYAVSWAIYCVMVGEVVHKELERMWKETIVV